MRKMIIVAVIMLFLTACGDRGVETSAETTEKVPTTEMTTSVLNNVASEQVENKGMSLNDFANGCSIISVFGLFFTIYQVNTMKKKTEACLEILKATKDFDTILPILKSSIANSNNNLKNVGYILEEVKKAHGMRPEIEDKIHELINMNDELRIKIENYFPENGESLSKANDYLRDSLNTSFSESKIDTAKTHMEKCHKELIKNNNSIDKEKDELMAHVFGNK